MKSPVSTKRKQRPAAKSAGRRKAGRSKSGSKPSIKTKPSVASKARRRPPPASGAGDPLDAFIAGAARALGLTIEPAWMPAVRANLRVTLTQAAAGR